MRVAKYFSATWCGPCKAFKPIMEELVEEGYEIQFIDIDDNMGLAKQYNVRSVPTTIIEERVVPSHVNVVETIIGARAKADIVELLNG